MAVRTWRFPGARLAAYSILVGIALALACQSASVLQSIVARAGTLAPAGSIAPGGSRDADGAGLIALAQHQLDAGQFAPAAESAASASSKTSLLDDYAQFIRAQAEYDLKNYNEVAKAVTHVFDQAPASPFVGPAAALAVRAELDNDSPRNGLELIKKYRDRIPQPEADLLLAQCYRGVADLPQSAEYFQRVYYNYPSAKEATDAANALVEIKVRMGDAYPPPLASAMIGRAQKLFELKNAAGAKIELAAAIPQLAGADRDLARVRLGVADYLSNHEHDAFAYLSALKVDDPAADAERLGYLIRCARKLDRHADVKQFLNQLEQQHADSTWRLDALILVADQGRIDYDPGTFIPLYRACALTFPKDSRAAWCHWQLAFNSYRKDGDDSYDLLHSHIERYADSEDANDALYFLGRLAERKNDLPSARACYNELITRFANTYYALVAHERLKDPGIQAAAPNPAMVEFLHSAPWHPRPQLPSFVPGDVAQSRIIRAHLLRTSGLNDLAEGELKFGARNDGEQETVYAFELAKFAAARGVDYQAMHYIKTYAPGYLFTSLDQAPIQFWKLAFPIPYRVSIERHSHEQSLDPFLVAALIRQESEFNPTVISYANAYGLMQLLPTTGRDLARQLKIRHFSKAQLLTAERNLQLGTYYFHNLLNSFGGRMELALASYNAGPSRANLWQSWGPFREQAEYVETVPFHQTRGYIQTVLRNADVYRRLYAGTIPDVPTYRAKPAPKTSTRRKPVRRKPRSPIRRPLNHPHS